MSKYNHYIYEVSYTDTKSPVRVSTYDGLDSEFSHYESRHQIERVAWNYDDRCDQFETIWRAKNSYRLSQLENLKFDYIGYIQIWKT